jgi:hypothetical protein
MVQVLDPLSVLCLLAILAHKPRGTKLVIEENRLTFSHPTARETARRWLFTWLFDPQAYSRQALCSLRKPIVRGLKWYSQKCPVIVAHATEGLRELVSLYESDRDNATEALRYCLLIAEKHRELPELLEIPEDAPRAEFLEQLQAMWSDEEVFSLETLVKLLGADAPGTNRVVIESIESYLNRKQPQLQPLMTQTAM